jgi:hypothetical protein
MPLDIPRAPLSAAQRAKLHRDLQRIEQVAARRGTTLDAWDKLAEQTAGRTSFEVGAWGYWAHLRGADITVEDRARVIHAVLCSGDDDVGYRFFTVFHFGERDFDNFFEQGDSAQVLEDVARLIDASGNDVARDLFTRNGWDKYRRQPALLI